MWVVASVLQWTSVFRAMFGLSIVVSSPVDLLLPLGPSCVVVHQNACGRNDTFAV